MNNFTNFITLLESLGIPLACNRFNEPQELPFLIYLDSDSENFGADNIVYYEAVNIDVRLYTKEIDDELETKIRQLFTSNGIYYDWSRNWIESEKMYQITYEVII